MFTRIYKENKERWQEFVTKKDFSVSEVDWESEVENNARQGMIRVVCMSDTHSQHDKAEHSAPPGDVFIHTGDFTNYGRREKVQRFNAWLATLPHKHKIVIAGNHEITFDPKSFANCEAKKKIFGANFDTESPEVNTFPNFAQLLTNCIYLEDSGVEVLGLKIYGTPWVPGFGSEWGFTLMSEWERLERWRLVPADTDLLLTHCPPLGIGDRAGHNRDSNIGCPQLLRYESQ